MNLQLTENLDLNYTATEVCDTSNMTENQWLKWRTTGIGGSDAAACLDVNPYKTARELFYEKTGVKPVIEKEFSNWIACDYGHALEELVARVFSHQTGLEVFEVKKMYQHPLYPFMQANVDRFVKMPDGSVAILECKTCTYNAKDKWENGAIPLNYEIQVRQYMAVMNISTAYIACLWDNNENGFTYRKIERNLEFEKNLINKEAEFWECVKNNTPPAFTEDGNLALLAIQKYIAFKDNEKQLSESFSDSCERWLELKKQKSEKEKEVNEIKKMMSSLSVPLVEGLDGNCSGVIETEDSKFYISFKGRSRTGINKTALSRMKEHDPDIYEKYVETTESSPTFSLKKYEVKDNDKK